MQLSKICNSSSNISIRLGGKPDLIQLAELYRSAGWMTQQDPADSLQKNLNGSYAWCTAWDGETLVGFMRALSDGVSDAYMLDLIVRNDYRKLGIGRSIVHALAGHLKEQGLEWIVCIGVPGSEKFYGKTDAEIMDGFTPYRFY